MNSDVLRVCFYSDSFVAAALLGHFPCPGAVVPVPLSILPSCLRTADVVLAKPALGFCLQHFCRPELPQSTEMKGLSPIS